MTAPQDSTRTTSHRRAGIVWGTAVAVYAIAVMHRSSLGVAGIEASERFGTGASSLATFVVVQLVVYAGLQVPVGLLLDRAGARLLISGGAALMAVGQLVMALATSVELAVIARVLIGAGDALTFVSVVRLLPAWFPLRRVPLFTQLTGIIGLLGQVLAAVPLVLLLHARGWTVAFVATGLLGLAAAVTVALVVRNAPPPVAPDGRPAPLATGEQPVLGAVVTPGSRRGGRLGSVLRRPGSWLGFFIHFVTGFSVNVIVLLWGSPFLQSAEGRSPAEVSTLLTLTVITALLAGPVIGQLTGGHPERRMTVVIVVVTTIGLAWAGLLLPTEPLPFWALALFMVAIGIGAPASLVGLDVARAHNPRHQIGTATAMANTGSFVAALLTMVAVGLVLDLRSGGSVAASLADYRAALSTVAATGLVGIAGVVVSARAVRRRSVAPVGREVRDADPVDPRRKTP